MPREPGWFKEWLGEIPFTYQSQDRSTASYVTSDNTQFTYGQEVTLEIYGETGTVKIADGLRGGGFSARYNDAGQTIIQGNLFGFAVPALGFEVTYNITTGTFEQAQI